MGEVVRVRFGPKTIVRRREATIVDLARVFHRRFVMGWLDVEQFLTIANHYDAQRREQNEGS